MVRHWPGRLAGLAVLVAIAQSAWAGDVAVGDRVVLRAENPLGIPLHRHARSNLFGRGAGGAQGDVLALEILATHRAYVAWTPVMDGLEAYAGGNRRVDLQACGGERQQHVGFLWNAERVALSEPRDLWHLNGAARDPSEACAGNLRPGRGAYVAALPGGADFNIVAVHADSGIKARDIDHRAAVLDRLNRLYGDLTASRADPDVVVVGDFNTMGAIDRMDAEAENARFDAVLRGEAPGFRRIAPDLRCTEYFDGRCGWLDHVVISMPMREAAEAVAIVSGHCAVLRGQDFDAEPPAAYRALSDHCPVVVDIVNEDRD